MTVSSAAANGALGAPERARASLLPFLLGLLAAAVVTQVVVALTGVGPAAAVLVALTALGAAGYLFVLGRGLGQLRFGVLVAHAILYVTVTGGFAVHALLRAVFGSGVDPAGWGGVLVAMPAGWSVGLVLHALGALLDRGFEASRS